MDYQDFNKFITKNYYFLLLIGKFLNCLSCAKQFPQLDPTSAQHQIKIIKKMNRKQVLKLDIAILNTR